jgi:multidrug efflux pump subunit AcrA (membrane-fusion protein)
MSRWIRIAPLAVMCVVVAGLALAREDDPAKDKKKADAPKAPKPPTHKVETGPFRVELSLKGVFETPAMSEVSVHFEAWSPPMAPLTVVSASEPGTVVKKGDTILKLDTDRIDKIIRDLESDQHLADLSLKQLEVEVAALDKTTPLDMAAAERAKKFSDEDWKRFNEIDKPFAEESIKVSNKMSHQMLEYAQEELKQLEKMYRSKDLTEETEEIILKRQRNEIEYYTFMVKQADMRKDQFFAFDLPRRIERVKEDFTRSGLAWEKAKTTLPMQLQQRKLALDKVRYERARSAERLANLKSDRELFIVKSPADGIVYYGRCSQGNFATAGSLISRLQRGGMIQADEVVMTIVQARPLFVRATADEKEFRQISVGGACKVIPTATPDVKLDGKIDRVSTTPMSPGNFDVRASVELGDAKLYPGMACTVKLSPYLREKAIAVPAGTVFSDELDEDKMHVYVFRADPGKFEKRSVVVGKKSGGKVEITSGLKAGDEIALSKPDSREMFNPAMIGD